MVHGFAVVRLLSLVMVVCWMVVPVLLYALV